MLKSDFTELQTLPAEWLNDAAMAIPHLAEITVGAEAANVITVTIQVRGADALPASELRLLQVWLADAVGGGVTPGVPDGGVTVITGAAVAVYTADGALSVVTDAGGVVVLEIEESTAETWHLHVGDGGRVAVAEVAFA